MESERGFDPKKVAAVIIDGACLWGCRRVQPALDRIRQDRHVIILNRMELPDPASGSAPIAALFLICREYNLTPRQCLVIDHDHRRAHQASLLGFQAAVSLQRGSHARKLVTAGLLALQDLVAMDILYLNDLLDLEPILQIPRQALD